ncbi:Retinoblastoma family protein [Hypsibius exemplaris]|uniref:Retinoblastoma family protein n=1 Tax=Hypsibius exemplaris TaxID=2072580 RepID=A0A1W0WN63_HYPEX|nr:Retinoblastoma family protein [Hypsibius exemplaris]
MARQRNRESTPENPAEEVRTRFLTITKEANLDQKTCQNVYTFFESSHVKYSMEGDQMDWLLPGAYAHAISVKPAAFESRIILLRLLRATSLSVPNFYARLKNGCDICNLQTAARDTFLHAERYFQISRTIFERFEQMFMCVFRDPLDGDQMELVLPRAMELRGKKKINFPKIIQSVDVYVFAWDLFVRARRSAVVIRDDLVTCYHLLICVMDCVCSNVLAMKRSELLNPGCSILPVEAEEGAPHKYFSLRPYLCAKFEGINRDCDTLYQNCFLPLMAQLVKDQELSSSTVPGYLELMSEDNFEKNLRGINTHYENLIRVACLADERVLLVSQDVAAPGAGGDPMNVIDVIDTMKERRKIFPTANRKLELNDFKTPTPVMLSPTVAPTPLTPSSSCSALQQRSAHESVKSPPLQTAVDLVTQLTNLVSGRTHAPSEKLKEIIILLYEGDVTPRFVERVSNYREKLVTAYIQACDPSGLAEPYMRQRFMFAQTWYFKLVEDMLVSERNRNTPLPRIKNLAESEKFHISLFALAAEMVLFSYNCSKMFPWPIEVLQLSPYDFVRMIEPVVLLEQLPKQMIKHFGRIEETIYEQMVWKADSPVWAEISSVEADVMTARDVCWSHNLEDNPASNKPNPGDSKHGRRSGAPLVPTAAPSSSQNATGSNVAPAKAQKNTAVCLFFRKIYVLAGVRLRDICAKLGFDKDVERKHHVFQRMFTLFENAITLHTDLLKDRHLDQVLLCCAYVVSKLETANGLAKSFHLIMNAYRFQAQAESRVYRSVLISGPDAGSAEPEVRADIITFYNQVFVRVMQGFIAKFSPKKKGQATPGGVILSPVPRVPGRDTRRQIHPAAKIYLSPRKVEPPAAVAMPPPTNSRVLTFTFGVTGQIDSLISANAAKQGGTPLPGGKRVAPASSSGSGDASLPAPAPKKPKKEKKVPPPPIIRPAISPRIAARQAAAALANGLPPPLAEPPATATPAVNFQDAAMPASL